MHYLFLPLHVANKIGAEVLSEKQNTTVGILGLAFKENVSDTRNSPSIELLTILTSTDIDVVVYDPLVKDSFGVKKADNLDEILDMSSIIVLCVGHQKIIKELKEKDLSGKILFDPRNLLQDLKSKVRKYVGLTV